MGDVLGSVYENPEKPFKTRDWRSIDLIRDDTYFTDDTVLTIATMDGINNGTAGYSGWKHYHKKWVMKYPRAGYGKRFLELVSGKIEDGVSNGNGATMRVSPIGLSTSTYILEACEQARWSHDTEEAIQGALIVASIVRNNVDPEFEYVMSDPWKSLISTDIDSMRENTGWSTSTYNTVPLAIKCFLEANNFEDTIRLAISMGSDTDTVASIAGAMAAATWGVPDDIVKFVRRKLTLEMIEIIDRFVVDEP